LFVTYYTSLFSNFYEYHFTTKCIIFLYHNINITKIQADINDKIKKVCREIYGANDIEISQETLNDISKYEKMGYKHLPICIAKTQYSLSDNPKLLGRPTNFNIHIKDVRLCSGAGFIVVIAGNIMTMPGLSKTAAYLNMDIDAEGNISGLF